MKKRVLAMLTAALIAMQTITVSATEVEIKPGEYTFETADVEEGGEEKSVSSGSGTNLVMTYNSDEKEVSGNFNTTESVVCLEVYTTKGYLANGNEITVYVGSAGYKLSSSSATPIKEDGNINLKFAGTVPIEDYGLDCNVIYATLPEGASAWQVYMDVSSKLTECFVIRAQVPNDWNSSSTVRTSSPLEMMCYFINSEKSSIDTSMITTIAKVESSAVSEIQGDVGGYAEVQKEEKVDSVSKLLIMLIFVAAIGVAVTYMLIKKQKNNAEIKRRDTAVKKQNKKIQNKKAKESDLLRAKMEKASKEYEDDYEDDDLEDDFNDDLENEEKKAEEPVAPQENTPVQNVQMNNMTNSGVMYNDAINNVPQPQMQQQTMAQQNSQMRPQVQNLEYTQSPNGYIHNPGMNQHMNNPNYQQIQRSAQPKFAGNQIQNRGNMQSRPGYQNPQNPNRQQLMHQQNQRPQNAPMHQQTRTMNRTPEKKVPKFAKKED